MKSDSTYFHRRKFIFISSNFCQNSPLVLLPSDFKKGPLFAGSLAAGHLVFMVFKICRIICKGRLTLKWSRYSPVCSLPLKTGFCSLWKQAEKGSVCGPASFAAADPGPGRDGRSIKSLHQAGRPG
jgi:hypothetical protein